MKILMEPCNADGPTVMTTTDGMDVEIYQAFVGPMFWTDDGEGLGVCMRDSGFHLQYVDDTGEVTDIVLNNGNVSVR